MFTEDETKLTDMGAAITTHEIKQQPELWQETYQIYQTQKAQLDKFIQHICHNTESIVRVIFVGAGTSAYVGNTIVPYLNLHGDRSHFCFEAIDTTKIVATPTEYLEPDTPTLLVSFARSGDSPESVATVNLAHQLIKHLWELTITCNSEGQLAQTAIKDENNFLMMMPQRSNDQGFAMTGSFSCMALSALLVFDITNETLKEDYIKTVVKMGQEVISREIEIQQWVDTDFKRIIYLGSGALAGLTQEAQLKILELTAGKIATLFDSSMGFRHGPKSFVNNRTLVLDFINNDPYTRQYDLDILKEVQEDKIALKTLAIGVGNNSIFSDEGFWFESSDRLLPDGYLALPDIMIAQTLALLTSIHVGNTPDTPSATGTVNRVVKGVTIHPYQ